MELHIVRNPLRLLGQTFLHLQPERVGRFAVGGRYPCSVEGYGKVGEVECLQVFATALCEMKPLPESLDAGHSSLRDIFLRQGCLNTDLIQHALFRFIRRSDTAFTALIDGETRRAGITIIRQSAMPL